MRNWRALDGVTNSRIVRNEATANSTSGFYVANSGGNAFVGNNAMHNDGHGFNFDEGASGDRWAENTSVGNGLNGFNLASNNPTDRPVSDNVFARNDVTNNAQDGFLVTNRSDRNTFKENRVTDNGAHGIFLVESSHNVLVGNVVTGHATTGVPLVEGSDWNRLVGNVSSNNGDVGFHIFTRHNTILGNEAIGNGAPGFQLSGVGARNNKLALNAACANASEDAVEDPDAGPGNVWLGNDFCTQDI